MEAKNWMGEAAEYFSKDFDWDELRIRVENDPLLQYHLLPFQPCDSIPSVSAEADSDAWSRFHLRHSSGKFFKVLIPFSVFIAT